jgi:hypothetical protein
MEFLKMPINLSQEQSDFLASKGITREQLGNDIDKFRQSGISDEEIQSNLSTKLGQMGFSMDSKTGESSTLQGGVTKNYEPFEMQRAALAGLTEIPRGVANIAEKYIPNAMTKGISNLLDRTEYEPKSLQGHVAKGLTSLGTAFLLPQAKVAQGASLFNKIGKLGASGAYQGGLLGATGAANAGEDPISGGIGGASFGGIFGGGLPAAGAGFEKIAPMVGRIADIPVNDYKRALDAIKKGDSIFNKDLKQSIANVNTQKKALSDMTPFELEDMLKIKDDVISSFSTGGGVNPFSEKIQSKLDDIERWLNESAINQLVQKPETVGNLRVNPADLHDIKAALQEWAKYGEDIQSGYKGQSNEILKKLASGYNEKLRGLSPEYAKANEAFQDALAAQQFRDPLRFNNPYAWARLGSGLGISGITGNPLFMGAEIAGSPLVHRGLLESYNLGQKASPFFVSGSMAGYNQTR